MLRCHRYVDLNPVRARMIDDPAAYAWSSCASHCGQHMDALIKPYPAYATGSTQEVRGEAYRDLLRETVSHDDLSAIRTLVLIHCAARASARMLLACQLPSPSA